MSLPKPPAPADWNSEWLRITVDPADTETAWTIKLAISAAHGWLLGPQGPFHCEGMTPANVTGEAVRQGLLHLLELGLIDIDRDRLNQATSFPLHRDPAA